MDKEEREMMAEEEERIRKLGSQGAFDYGYSDKMNKQMMQEMMQIDSNQYAKVLENIPKGSYIYPETVVSKIRNDNPNLIGQPILPPEGEKTLVDLTGKYNWTLNNFITGNPYSCSGFAPVESYTGAKERLLNYPEFWATFRMSFSQIMVPVLKYIESCNWTFFITSSFRKKELSRDWKPWLGLENYRTLPNPSTSDHDKGCAFDLNPTAPKLPKKITVAILYKKILLQQIPNLPPNNVWARQVLVEHTIGTAPWGTSGWVHLAASRFETDVSRNYQYAFMGQIKGGGQQGRIALSPSPGSRSGKLINENDVVKVDGVFKSGLASFFAATAGYNWNNAPSDKLFWMNEVRKG